MLKIKSFKVQIIHVSYFNSDTVLFASYKNNYLLHFAIWIKEIGQTLWIFSLNLLI